MATKNIEIQDSTGNIYYPHTDASIVKFGDSNVNATLSDMVYQVASGSATAITLTIKGTLVTGYPITFIASANNGGAATTINGKKLYKPGTTTSPNLIAGKAYTVWYNSISDCFFIKASAEGDADVSSVLATKKFSNDNDTGLVGTMPNNGAVSSTLTNSNQEYIIPAGFHNGLGKIKVIVTNLAAEAIKAGTTVGGIVGTFTSDATAAASDISSGKTAYVNGNKVTGTGRGYSPGTTVLSGNIDLKFNQKWKSTEHGYYNTGNYMCSDGNYVYGFFSQSSQSADYIAKYDLNGNLIWQKTIGYYSVKMCTDDSGNLYVSYLDLVVTKYDTNGVQKWSFSNSYYDTATAMIYVNGYLILNQNTGMIRFNTADGSYSSVAADPSNTSVKCIALAAGKDGCFYAAMSNKNIVKFDTSFNKIWTINPSTSSNRVSLFVDNSNNLCIFITDSKAYKYDSNGNKIWEQSMGDGDLKFVDKNNYWYIIGERKTSITQFNPNGERTWMFNDSVSDALIPETMYVDNNLNVYYMIDAICKMRSEYTIIS
ncbi:hypothetical protein [Clostridium sp. YIM B02569]|uniref:hypothetical protein n=1 Tax=Clostridium sp. YIM B02569 TaxID=2911967 RepID=UPI001EEBEF6A|nr:hypothetical protein [Clostridium sp. YIM B02569]